MSAAVYPPATEPDMLAIWWMPPSSRNISQVSLSSDNVFRDDGGIHQIASMSGSVAGGYTAALTIGV